MMDYFDIKVPIKTAAEILSALQNKDLVYNYLNQNIYDVEDTEYLESQRQRYIQTIKSHIERVGETVPTWLLRAPGRLNAFLEYLDMCQGDHMSTTIDGDIPIAVSPRDDKILSLTNVNPLFEDAIIDFTEAFDYLKSKKMAFGVKDSWDNRTLHFPYAGRKQGDWQNYLLSPYLRFLWEYDNDIKGADITFGPSTIPYRAGVSSSSAVVVLSFLTMYYTNQEMFPKLTNSQVGAFLGEAEWYVGTHGGANDQMTILFTPKNSISYNRHSRPVLTSDALPFIQGINVVLANSLWEANKSAGGNQSFNIRKDWILLGDTVMKMIIKRAMTIIDDDMATGNWLTKMMNDNFKFFTGDAAIVELNNSDNWRLIARNYNNLGSLSEDILGVSSVAVEELITLLPVKLRPDEVKDLLGYNDVKDVLAKYTKPRREIGGYHLRTAARFFLKENRIGYRLEKIFLEANEKVKKGELTYESAEYDEYRVEVGRLVDKLQDALMYDFRVSTSQLDLLLDIAKRGPGYLGGKLTGAGKGGCVSILVREESAKDMCDYLDDEYYSKQEYFEQYRQILADEMTENLKDSFEYEMSKERLDNLNKELSLPGHCKRVFFSRGACVIDV